MTETTQLEPPVTPARQTQCICDLFLSSRLLRGFQDPLTLSAPTAPVSRASPFSPCSISVLGTDVTQNHIMHPPLPAPHCLGARLHAKADPRTLPPAQVCSLSSRGLGLGVTEPRPAHLSYLSPPQHALFSSQFKRSLFPSPVGSRLVC